MTSLHDAVEAQAGGADRLEVVRELEHGGLTPDVELVHDIAAAVKLPLRVMLRENTSMQLAGDDELRQLCRSAKQLADLKVDGLVAGFIKNDRVDIATLRVLAHAAPLLKITFHRAFDELTDPLQAIRTLKTVPQVDRILTIGGHGSWPERKVRLHHWQEAADPEITILAGGGVLTSVIADLRSDTRISEVHVGRAARMPQETGGQVSRVQVAQLKGLSA